MADVFVTHESIWWDDLDFDSLPSGTIVYIVSDEDWYYDTFAIIINDETYYCNGKTIHEIAQEKNWKEL